MQLPFLPVRIGKKLPYWELAYEVLRSSGADEYVRFNNGEVRELRTLVRSDFAFIAEEAPTINVNVRSLARDMAEGLIGDSALSEDTKMQYPQGKKWPITLIDYIEGLIYAVCKHKLREVGKWVGE